MRSQKCFDVRCGVLLGLLLLLVVGLAYAETLLVRETFCEPEGGIPAGWKPTMDEEGTVAIRQVPALAAPTCGAALELVDQSPAISPMLERSLEGSVRKGAFEYVVLNSTDLPGEIYGEIRAPGVGTVIDCHISTGRALKCRDGSALVTLVSSGVERGVWHTVRIEWDTATWTYRVKLNGADVTPEAGLRFTAQAAPTSVRFKLGSGPKVDQKAYIDQATVVAY
ncbi:MAG TPA: hypothetical protein GXX29_14120 [Firmicutes bacterium]|nr:hypothetical protein [Bacillota bacterium]